MTANELIAQALAKLDGASREVALDLSSVSRIDPSAIGALEKLAGAADEKAVKVAMRGVHVDVYKVLKLVKLTPRFSFPAR